ncbi:MAG: hypothetical protein KDK39_16315, partial [Leptospiraceae bacterium]|nr:hypothetical protein [Leptospiraceae bacterium]
MRSKKHCHGTLACVSTHVRGRFLLYLTLTGVLVLGLDRLVYNKLIFLPANHSGWDSYRWFNFESNYRHLQQWRQRHPTDKLVLFMGSSIARYATQIHISQALLNREDVKIGGFMHAAMMPVDMVGYLPRLRQLRPDLIVYLTNPADLDLERYTQPWQAGPAYERQH